MKILIKDNGMYKLPHRAHDNDCGADVYSPETISIWPHETVKINLKFAVDIPAGYSAFVFPRSGLSSKGITCELPPIDSSYSGNIHAIVTNNTDKIYTIVRGDRIGQLVVLPCVVCDFITEKGAERAGGAFGSTGK